MWPALRAGTGVGQGQGRTDEIFTSWTYARYVGRWPRRAKRIPAAMYMNAYTYGFPKANDPVPSSGSPMPEVFDVWRAGAPGIDIFSPDNSRTYIVMSGKYTQSGNPLFIPRNLLGRKAPRALYAFGHHDAIGYSRMSGGVDRLTTPDNDLAGATT